jgi:voltage-gated potassium channel
MDNTFDIIDTGVGLFGVLTGLFARLLVEPELKKEDSHIEKLSKEMRLLREKVEQMQERDRK